MTYNTQHLRRQERRMPEAEACRLLRTGMYGVLCMQGAQGGGYGVPLHYAWDGTDTLFFHAAAWGRKRECLAADARVCFCVVGEHKVLPPLFSTAYQSIIAEGTVAEVTDRPAKLQALRLLLEKYTPGEMQAGLQYAEKAVDKTLILALTIKEWCGKHRNDVP